MADEEAEDSLLGASPENGLDLSGVANSEGEYERMTAAEVLEKLEEAWINEKFAPDLLEHKTEIVECMLQQVKEMEETLSQASKGDFVARIHKMELDRVRYVLCSYLRIRLKKIEKYVVHILEKEAVRDPLDSPALLSPEELAYAKEYADSLSSHFKTLLLNHMPPNCKEMDRKKAVEKPNMEQYVFMRAMEKRDQVVVDPDEDGEAIDLLPGNQYILHYQPVEDLVKTGSAILI